MSLRGPRLELNKSATEASALLPSEQPGTLQHRLGRAGTLATTSEVRDVLIGSYFWDCFATPSISNDLVAQRLGVGNGNGAAILSTLDYPDAMGVANFTTGTAGDGFHGIALGTTVDGLALAGGAGLHTHAARLAVPTLSGDSGQEFIVISGFVKNVPSRTAGDAGAWFVYDRVGASQGAVASNNWQCICRSSLGTTNVVTSVAVPTNVMQKLRVVINGITGVATFFIDDLLVATISTNVPTANTAVNRFAWVTKIIKTAGLIARTINLDWVYWKSVYQAGGTPAPRVIP